MDFIRVSNMSCPCYPVGNYPKDIKENTDRLAEKLLEYLESNYISLSNIVLVVTGSSGTIIGTLLSIHIPPCMIWHIRKDGESSHQSHREHRISDRHTLIFVDDFMSSGSTYKRVYNEVQSILGRPLDISCTLGYTWHYMFEDYPVTKAVFSNNNKED